MQNNPASTIDTEEVERFSRLAETWWDENGPMRPLHKINPVRVGWIRDKIIEHFNSAECRVQSAEKENSALSTHNSALPAGLRLLDIGCGGGLVCEPMARLGATVTGVDASAENIDVAKAHARQAGLTIDYRCTTAEELCGGVVELWSSETLPHHPITPSPHHSYDVVLALEIVEHVADVPAFVAATANLVKPGGLLIYSTLNRTAKSFALAIVGAEYVLRWVPRGTHDWNKFLKPSELVTHLRHNNIDIKEMTGMVLNPLTWKWELNPRDVDVNYFIAGTKP